MKNPTNLSYFSFDLRPFFVGKLLAVCHTCAMGGMGGWGDTDRLPFSLVSSPP